MSEDKDELTDLTTGSPEEENDAHSITNRKQVLTTASRTT